MSKLDARKIETALRSAFKALTDAEIQCDRGSYIAYCDESEVIDLTEMSRLLEGDLAETSNA